MPGRLEQGGTRAPREAPVCRNCGAPIHWFPIVHDGAPYCCQGCAQGGPCYCSYDQRSCDRHLNQKKEFKR